MTTEPNNPTFDLGVFLTHAGLGRRIIELKEKENFFSQGDPADSVFYLQSGRARLTVISQAGKEATITLLSAGSAGKPWATQATQVFCKVDKSRMP